jgi:Cu2+-exporting ATPase
MTFAASQPAAFSRLSAKKTGEDTQSPNIYLALPTIHCAGCIAKIERALLGMEGISSARVNLSLKRVAIVAMPEIKSGDIVKLLGGIGFEAQPLDTSLLEKNSDTLARDLLIRMAVAGFAMMNVMLLSVAVWSGAGDATRDLFQLISAAITLPVIAF